MPTHPTTFAAADRTARRRAFTMTELLIVIGLIVLVIAIAVPAFRAMTGGRSVDAAQNQLAAVLGVARAEAIGLQKVRGVFFFIDPATERVNVALVQEADYTPRPSEAPTTAPDYYLDLVPDRDPVALPVGVGLQGIDNAELLDPATRRDDGYIGYQPLPGLTGSQPLYGGAILFDGSGRVINKFYGFHLRETVLVGNNRVDQPTRLAQLLGYGPTDTPPPHYVAQQSVGGAGQMTRMPALSLFGFVLYDAELFRSAGRTAAKPGRPQGEAFTSTPGDPQYDPRAGTYAGNERFEEVWLDENALPVIINRYNGTLVRGE